MNEQVAVAVHPDFKDWAGLGIVKAKPRALRAGSIFGIRIYVSPLVPLDPGWQLVPDGSPLAAFYGVPTPW